MTQSLVDLQGFPRNDVDVHQVLIARNNIIRLQNDRKAVTTEIEAELLRFHAAARREHGQPSPPAESAAFAEVDGVAPDSPAAEAGLQRRDRIVKFGHVTSANHRNLAAVGEIVNQSEGVRCSWVANDNLEGCRGDYSARRQQPMARSANPPHAKKVERQRIAWMSHCSISRLNFQLETFTVLIQGF